MTDVCFFAKKLRMLYKDSQVSINICQQNELPIKGAATLKIERSFNCLAKKLHQKFNKINLWCDKNKFLRYIHTFFARFRKLLFSLLRLLQ